MASTLVLALPEAGWQSTQACDHLLSADGRGAPRHARGSLAALPRADALVLLVPPTRLSWHRVALPPLPTRRVPAALAGLLEDRLLDDPATLAFALAPGPAAADGSRLVAVCDRAWLEAAIAGAAERGLRLQRVAPAHPPAGSPTLTVRDLPDGPQAVRASADQVLALPLEQAALLAPAWDGAGPTPPLLQAEESVRAQAEAAFGRSARAWSLADALWRAARSEWDLAQFELAAARRSPGLRRIGRTLRAAATERAWRPLRWGLGLLLLAQFVGLNAWAWRLQSERDARREQARALLLQAFPGVRSVVDAPAQMERELAALRRNRGVPAAGDADAMLAALGAALPGTEGAQSVRFAGGELSLVGVPLEPAAWEQARARLAAQGYRAERDGARVVLRPEVRP